MFTVVELAIGVGISPCCQGWAVNARTKFENEPYRMVYLVRPKMSSYTQTACYNVLKIKKKYYFDSENYDC